MLGRTLAMFGRTLAVRASLFSPIFVKLRLSNLKFTFFLRQYRLLFIIFEVSSFVFEVLNEIHSIPHVYVSIVRYPLSPNTLCVETQLYNFILI